MVGRGSQPQQVDATAEPPHPPRAATSTTKPILASSESTANRVLYFDSMKVLCLFVFQWQRKRCYAIHRANTVKTGTA